MHQCEAEVAELDGHRVRAAQLEHKLNLKEQHVQHYEDEIKVRV